MTPELLNKLKHLANIAAHLPHDVTLEDEDAAMKALHGELAADTVLQMIALAEHTLLAAAPAPIHETIVQQNGEMVCTACGTAAALAGSQVQAAGDAVVDDLVMLVRRLVRSLEKSNPGTDLAPQALDYLKRKGLQGSPLRADKPNADCSGEPANCPDNEGYGCACDPMNKAGSAKP